MQVGRASPRVEGVPVVAVLEGSLGLLAQEECCRGGGAPGGGQWPGSGPSTLRGGCLPFGIQRQGVQSPGGVLEVPVVLSFSLSLLPRLPPTPPGAGPRSSLEKAGGGSRSPRLWSHVQEGLALAPGVPGGPPGTLFQLARGRGCVARTAMTSGVSPWLWRGCRMLLGFQLGLRSPRAGCQAGGPLFCLGLGARGRPWPQLPHPTRLWPSRLGPGAGAGSTSLALWPSGDNPDGDIQALCVQRRLQRGLRGSEERGSKDRGCCGGSPGGAGWGGQRGKGSQHAACGEGAPAGGDPSAARGPGWGRPGRRRRVPLKGAQPALVSSHPLPWL